MTTKQMKLLRLYHGLTQKEFGERTGLSENLIAKVEAGHLEVSTTTKARVLRKYDLLNEGFIEFCQRMNEAEQ